MFGFMWKYLKNVVGMNSKEKSKKPSDKKSNQVVHKSANESLENEKLIEGKLKELEKSLEESGWHDREAITDILVVAKYLYKNGYQSKGTLDFLGKGGFNTVFRIRGTDTVVKYCIHGKNKECSADELPLREFEEMVKQTKDEKLKKWAKKYLPNIKRINNKDIYEDSLGISDLMDSFANRRGKNSKTIDSLLKKARRATKAIKVFHDNGYIHQDIKLENILKISNPKYSKAMEIADKDVYLKDDKGHEYCVVSQEIQKNNEPKIRLFKKYKDNKMGNKITKNTINVIDVGLMRKIKDLIGKTQQSGTPGYIAYDSLAQKTTDKDDVKKWDVYALGIVFFELLCGRYPSGEEGYGLKETIDLSTDWPPSLSEKTKDMKEFAQFYMIRLSKMYSEDQFNRIYYFMKLINLMTVERKKRILLDEVLKKLEFIENYKEPSLLTSKERCWSLLSTKVY